MKKLIVLTLLTVFISCSKNINSSYDTNVKIVKKFLELQASEGAFEDQLEMIHADVMWQPAFYGADQVGKEGMGQYLKGWQDAMEGVVYTPENYLPGVSDETKLADGSVRSYGKWTGIHSATGKSWEITSYHTWDFKDGKIVAGGDYFDAGGLTNFLMKPASLETE